MYNRNTFAQVPATFFYDGMLYNFFLMSPLAVLTVTPGLFFTTAELLQQWVT